jgi:hypothetical protein
MSDERIQPWTPRPPVGRLTDLELDEIRDLLSVMARNEGTTDLERLQAWNYVKLIDQKLQEDD